MCDRKKKIIRMFSRRQLIERNDIRQAATSRNWSTRRGVEPRAGRIIEERISRY